MDLSCSKYTVKKSSLCGEIAIPASKSQTLRAILFASLAKGNSFIDNYLDSPDTHAMIEACRLFGACIEVSKTSLNITGCSGKIECFEDVINAGNSGIVLRFCSAVGALANKGAVVTGDYSIRHQRPMKQLIDGLCQLGGQVTSMRGDDFAPVIIQKPIVGGKAVIFGEDSQPVSALLIAAAFASRPTELKVVNPGEKPWVALTLDWFDRLGIVYENNNFCCYRLQGLSSIEGFHYTVPADISSAAFPIGAALVTGSEITLKGIDFDDKQGDKALISVFQKMGAKIEIDREKKSLYVRKGSELFGVDVDINDFIDALPILSVVACFAKGQTTIYNASIAKQKECNRIACIASELKKMGANVTETQDGLKIQKSELTCANLYSHKDHRMAMALAVAGLAAFGKTTISSVECVCKTYPFFLEDFKKLQANIEAYE